MKNFKRILMFLLCVCTLVLTMGITKVNAATYTGTLINDATKITAGDYIIACYNDGVYYYMSNTVNDSAPSAKVLTVSNNKVLNIPDDAKWSVNTSGSSWTISTNDNYLYATSATNNGIRCSTDTATWTITTNDSYLRFTTTVSETRFLSMYNTQDFRYYVATSGNHNMVVFKIEEIDLITLDVPNTVSLTEKVLTFDSVTNAVSYNVGLFNSSSDVEPFKTFTNVTSSPYTIDFTPQGTFYVGVMAVGDMITYGTSFYIKAEDTLIISTISIKTVKEFRSVSVELTAPYTYYETTGFITEITDASTNRFKMVDVNDTDEVIIVNGLLNASKEATTLEALDVNLYDTITLIGYLAVDNPKTIGGAYYVSSEYNIQNEFHFNTMCSSLYANYDYTDGEVGTSSVTMRYTNSVTSTNMTGNNDAELVGLDSNIFTVKAYKGSYTSSYPGLNKANDIRLYAKNNDGSYLIISSIKNISSIKITCSKNTEDYVVEYTDENKTKVSAEGGSTNNLSTFNFNTNTTSFVIRNNGDATVQITSIVINYETVSNNYIFTSVSMRFGTVISKKLYDAFIALDENAEFGVIIAKTSDIQNTLTMDYNSSAEYVHTVICNPARVNAAGDENTSDTGEYYQFAVLLNGFTSENYGTEYQAICYVKCNGTVYFMSEEVADFAKYSVNTLAALYITENRLTDLISVGALNELSK